MITEYNLEDHMEVIHKKGLRQGLEKGREEVNYVLELVAQGLSYEEIRKKLEENKSNLHKG